LRAYSATGDRYYLNAATGTPAALIYGQLKSGGWTNAIDFDPMGKLAAHYRNSKGRGKNNSLLDDDQTTAAIRFLIPANKAHEFQNVEIHQAVEQALNWLLDAQVKNGAFPQVWDDLVERNATTTRGVKANFPNFDGERKAESRTTGTCIRLTITLPETSPLH
jgi:hypothetical protein